MYNVNLLGVRVGTQGLIRGGAAVAIKVRVFCALTSAQIGPSQRWTRVLINTSEIKHSRVFKLCHITCRLSIREESKYYYLSLCF